MNKVFYFKEQYFKIINEVLYLAAKIPPLQFRNRYIKDLKQIHKEYNYLIKINNNDHLSEEILFLINKCKIIERKMEVKVFNN